MASKRGGLYCPLPPSPFCSWRQKSRCTKYRGHLYRGCNLKLNLTMICIKTVFLKILFKSKVRNLNTYIGFCKSWNMWLNWPSFNNCISSRKSNILCLNGPWKSISNAIFPLLCNCFCYFFQTFNCIVLAKQDMIKFLQVTLTKENSN